MTKQSVQAMRQERLRLDENLAKAAAPAIAKTIRRELRRVEQATASATTPAGWERAARGAVSDREWKAAIVALWTSPRLATVWETQQATLGTDYPMPPDVVKTLTGYATEHGLAIAASQRDHYSALVRAHTPAALKAVKGSTDPTRKFRSTMRATLRSEYAAVADNKAARIAWSETLQATESIRYESARVTATNTRTLRLRKVWFTHGDSKVREAHQRANGQSRFVEDRGRGGQAGRFNVGGERLRYPRDPGGSPGNVINCRCFCEYRKVKAKPGSQPTPTLTAPTPPAPAPKPMTLGQQIDAQLAERPLVPEPPSVPTIQAPSAPTGKPKPAQWTESYGADYDRTAASMKGKQLQGERNRAFASDVADDWMAERAAAQGINLSTPTPGRIPGWSTTDSKADLFQRRVIGRHLDDTFDATDLTAAKNAFLEASGLDSETATAAMRAFGETPGEQVSNLIAQTWQHTSGDTNPAAVAYQHAVSLEFGLPWPPSYRMGHGLLQDLAVLETDSPNVYSILRAHARATYTETQSYVAEIGNHASTMSRDGWQLWRGTRMDGLTEAMFHDVELNSLSSFAFDIDTAFSFAYGSERGALLVSDVPLDRIFSLGELGFGVVGESEVIVLGSTTADEFFSVILTDALTV